MPIQYQCGSSMAIRQICHYKYTNRIYIIQILVRWSGTMWHEKRLSKDSRFFAYKGTREAKLRNSSHIYNPPKPSFDKEGLLCLTALAFAVGKMGRDGEYR